MLSGHRAAWLDAYRHSCQAPAFSSPPTHSARLAGAEDGGRRRAVMEGKDFRREVTRDDGSVDKHKFWQLWPHLRVLARCNPTDKLIIVKGEPSPKGLWHTSVVLQGWHQQCCGSMHQPDQGQPAAWHPTLTSAAVCCSPVRRPQ